MRAIKFRGKRVDNGKWVYGDLIQWDVFKYIQDDNNNNFYNPKKVLPETVGQLLTKIKRENGDVDEIFEGDLIIHGQRVLKVEFLKGNATLVNKEETTGILLSFNDGKNKVGNIYDNPELITN